MASTKTTPASSKKKTPHQKSGLHKLNELINDIKFAMLTTIDNHGKISSRPMATPDIRFNGSLWFFTAKSSGKVHSIVNDQRVHVAYASSDNDKYVSISGKAEIIQDKKKMRELWKPMYSAWFPKGIDDPELILIKVNVDEAEYWDTPSGRSVHVDVSNNEAKKSSGKTDSAALH
jgi:general stress protein 26